MQQTETPPPPWVSLSPPGPSCFPFPGWVLLLPPVGVFLLDRLYLSITTVRAARPVTVRALRMRSPDVEMEAGEGPAVGVCLEFSTNILKG